MTFFCKSSRMDEKEPLQEHISVWENPWCNIYYFLLIEFLRISYTGLHLCPFLSDVNQVFKDECSLWINCTFAAFFVTAFFHSLLLKASGSMNDFLEFLLEYLSRKKIKANDEKHKIKAFLNCQLGGSFSKLFIH